MGKLSIANQKFGRLTAISIVDVAPNRQTRWLCQCECGETRTVLIGRLRSGHTQSCGCLRQDKAREHCKQSFTLPTGEANFRRIFSHYRASAKRRNLNWSLTKIEFRQLISSPCYYCGQPPTQSTQLNSFENGQILRSGIDRQRSDLGYDSGNVVPCCEFCNYAKRQLSEEDFLKKVQQIARYRHL